MVQGKYTRLYGFLLIFFLAAFVFVLLISLVQKKLEMAGTTLSWWGLVLVVFFNYLIKGSLIFLSVKLTLRYLKLESPIWYSLLVHFVFSLVFIVLSYSLLIPIENLILESEAEFTFNYLLRRSMGGASFSFFLYFSMIFMVYAALFLIREQDNKLGQERMKNQLLDARMNVLRAQIQPHFLFNSLNSISYLVGIDVKRSKDAIADLSDLLRYTLKIKTNNLVTLSEEMKSSTVYLKLMKLRYDNNLEYSTKIGQGTSMIKVPPFIIQPVLENAVKYGFSSNHDQLRIEIFSVLSEGKLTLTIRNNGETLERNYHYGTGITNILMRLNELYGNDYGFQFNNSKGWVTTEISIPMQKA